ncbi:MAG: twin-arginine translocase subunit TatC [Chitinispirillales bacterium]|nr:twin-arginine translocase subunit TatC [Chitinispirillales bacterium]
MSARENSSGNAVNDTPISADNNSAISNGSADAGSRGRDKKMSLVDHLEEVRWVVIRSGCAVIVCAIPCGIFWRRIFNLVAIWPLRMSDPAPQIIYTSPIEAVTLSIKIALTGGVLLASPLIFQQFWSFISPGLYKKERAVILPAAFASTICFLAGVTFCYFMLPMLLKFLTDFAAGQIDPLFKVDEYFGFLIKISLAFGLAFQLPVVVFILSMMGAINHRFMIRHVRHAIVGIFIIAAILTPPDVLSQMLLALPLLALYGLSTLIALLVGRKAKK